MRVRGLAAAVLVTLLACAVPAADAATGFSQVSPAKRVALPTWSGATFDGAAWSTRQLKGTLSVVNIWASWCVPCQQEWPELQAAAVALPKVHFFGVNSMDDAASAKSFLAEHASTYPQLFDERYVLQSSLTTVPARTLPITLVLDAKGRIAAWKSGPLTRDQLVRAVYLVKRADAAAAKRA